MKPAISVVIPTRDRLELFKRAVSSVQKQTCISWEIVIVDSSASATTQDWFNSLDNAEKYVFRYVKITQQAGANSLGPSAARNVGVHHANAEIVAFLDDDDEWVDENHLADALACLEQHPNISVYLSQQEAVKNNTVLHHTNIWIENIHYKSLSTNAINEHTHILNAQNLLAKGNFCHLNCTIVRKVVFEELNGFDEALRYEEDKEFYFRLLNHCQLLIVTQKIVARHYIPQRNTASTTIVAKEKLLYQLQLYNKSIANGLLPVIRLRHEKSDVLKKLTLTMIAESDNVQARHFALSALSSRFSIKWMLYCLYLQFKDLPIRNK